MMTEVAFAVEQVVICALQLKNRKVWPMLPQCPLDELSCLVVLEVLAIDQIDGLQGIQLVLGGQLRARSLASEDFPKICGARWS